MDVQNSTRIVVLGKTGSGKSSLANTILGEDVFHINHAAVSDRGVCRAESRFIGGKPVTLIDTPGFFDTCASEELFKGELVRCFTETAPGPHAILIVLKVDRYTTHEQEIIHKIKQYFSEEAFSFATVVFTHGDQLEPNQTIEEFVRPNAALRDLVQKCGGRYHVVDNKYWNKPGQDKMRNNQFQVAKILGMIEANNKGYYTNEMFQKVMKELEQEEERIRQSPSINMSQVAIKAQARTSIHNLLLIKFAGVATGALIGAFLGIVDMVRSALVNWDQGGLSGVSRGAVASVAVSGAVKGGMAGLQVAQGAMSVNDAVEKTVDELRRQTNF